MSEVDDRSAPPAGWSWRCRTGPPRSRHPAATHRDARGRSGRVAVQTSTDRRTHSRARAVRACRGRGGGGARSRAHRSPAAIGSSARRLAGLHGRKRERPRVPQPACAGAAPGATQRVERSTTDRSSGVSLRSIITSPVVPKARRAMPVFGRRPGCPNSLPFDTVHRSPDARSLVVPNLPANRSSSRR